MADFGDSVTRDSEPICNVFMDQENTNLPHIVVYLPTMLFITAKAISSL